MNVTPSAQGPFANGTIDVEFIYINGDNCLEFNRTRRLTPNDTITVTTLFDNPNQARGYAYVFAKSPITGQAVKFDFLAGDSFQISPANSGGLDLPPIVFRASSGFIPGAATDVDNDGVRDLNGNEYEKVSDKLLVPRLLSYQDGDGDDDASSFPELILIGLTGQTFTTVVNFLIYNDNEEVFSSQYAFKCWERVGLQNISGVFRRNFLFFNTNHAASEDFRLGPGFALEYGWFRMDGAVAFSTAASVSDPAFLAVNIERNRPFGVATLAVAASLPYGIGEQGNGDLIQHGPFPDPN